MFKNTKQWPKKRINRLAAEIRAYMKHVEAPENGGHNIRIHDPRKAGCGICALMHRANDLAFHLENMGVKHDQATY